MQNIKYAIFDADGTILDSMPAWDGIAERYLKSIGLTPLPGLQEDMMNIGGHQLPAYFRENYGVKRSADEIRVSINGLLTDFYHNKSRPKPGVLGVLETLYGQGAKMCVATATDRELIEPALIHCGLMRYFCRIYTCREEGVSKHEPDIYLRAAEHLGGALGETYVFEDALYAIKTAKTAGFPVVAVYDAASDGDWDEAREIADCWTRTFDTFSS